MLLRKEEKKNNHCIGWRQSWVVSYKFDNKNEMELKKTCTLFVKEKVRKFEVNLN